MASIAIKTLALCALFGITACESTTMTNEPLPPVEEDDEAPPTTKKDAGGGTTTRDAGKKPVETPVDPAEPEDDDDSTEAPVAKPDAGGDEPTDETDAGTTTPPGEEEPMTPAQNKIPGSAAEAKCSSYGLPMGDQCGGYYCGITKADIEAELKPGSLCNPDPEKICDGGLTREVGKCARSVKSDIANALDTEAQIRMKVQQCVLKASAFADTEVECLGCFLDAAQCASDNCLTQCLTGDSAACDKCRMDNDCNQTVPTCAGFPSPF